MKRSDHHIDHAKWTVGEWSVGETKHSKLPQIRGKFDSEDHFWGARAHLEHMKLRLDGKHNYIKLNEDERLIKIIGEKNCTHFKEWLERHNPTLGHNIKTAEQVFKEAKEHPKAPKEKRIWVQALLRGAVSFEDALANILAEGKQERHPKSHRHTVKPAPRHPKGHPDLWQR